MAEGFELYHVPQQSRREKLRVVTGCVGDLLPLYDQSSFISSSPNLLSKQPRNVTSSLMAAATATSNSNASDYATAIIDESLDLQSVRDPDNDHCNFPYTHQDDLRFIQYHDQPFHGGDFLVYKPEPLALSLSSHKGTHPLQKYESTSLDFCRSAVMTLGPYTGYASILKGSKFLKPAQQLLNEICDVDFAVDYGLMTDPPSLENLRTSVDDPNCGGTVDTRKRSRLISLLDEVYKRYKHYYQQIQAVIASFETVAGLSSAAPFANLDLKAMSKNFRCLNNAITDQLQFSVKSHEHQISYGKAEFVWSGSSNNGLYGQRAINNMGFVDHQPVWRPQRGLPKRAVTVLRAWLFDHFLHPYPTDTDKQILAKQTGLSRNQVSNWFINARVRLWKPMVEEVHTLEARQVDKISSHIQEQEASPVISRDPSHRRNQDLPSKRPRNDFPSDDKYNAHHIMERNKEHMNFYDNFSIHGANNGANGNRGVSLTLGLHQNNNAITLSESFPLNSERFVIGGLDAQHHQDLCGDG